MRLIPVQFSIELHTILKANQGNPFELTRIRDLVFCGLDEQAQRFIHCFSIGESCRYIWLKQHQICPSPVSLDIFAPHPSFQLREIIFGSQIIRFHFRFDFLHRTFFLFLSAHERLGYE